MTMELDTDLRCVSQYECDPLVHPGVLPVGAMSAGELHPMSSPLAPVSTVLYGLSKGGLDPGHGNQTAHAALLHVVAVTVVTCQTNL